MCRSLCRNCVETVANPERLSRILVPGRGFSWTESHLVAPFDALERTHSPKVAGSNPAPAPLLPL